MSLSSPEERANFRSNRQRELQVRLGKPDLLRFSSRRYSAGMSKLRLGTRGSALARWQAEWVAARLTERGVDVELVPITTQGDVKTGPLNEIGGMGLFTKELQWALLNRQIDLAVHSLKDLPTDPVEGLALAAVPERESTADVLVSNQADRVESLPQQARIGTGSLRRKAQLLFARPDLVVEDIRGNVETRLRKLDDRQFDAIVLAEAGLKRLGLAEPIRHVIPRSLMLPAVGQGALGIEARADDEQTRGLLAPLDHEHTHRAVLAERTLLHSLGTGCMAPVGALAWIESNRLHLQAAVLATDGSRRIAANAETPISDAITLGHIVAEELLLQGAGELIAAARTR
jgi:hydroxymethylbilane synthase